MKYNKTLNDILGQEHFKTALLILAVSPVVKSLLVAGEKGSGKSSTIRAFGNLEDENLIEVPQNITEDRMYGSIDLERFLKNGEKSFEEGLLSESSEGFLYFDEINLFDMNLLSAVLDFIEIGEVQIEREGFSLCQNIDLGVIGSMNPEEGELKADIVDKFALYVYIEGLKDVEDRKAIIKQHIFPAEEIPTSKKDKDYAQIIQEAKTLLPYIAIKDDHIAFADSLVRSAKALGFRPAFYILETAKTLAALDHRTEIRNEDLTLAANFVLPHRKNQLENSPPRPTKNEAPEEQEQDKTDRSEEPKEEEKNQPSPLSLNEEEELEPETKEEHLDQNQMVPKTESKPQLVKADSIYRVREYIKTKEDRIFRKGSGKRNLTLTQMKKGKVIGSKRGNNDDIAIFDSIKASILNGGFDRTENKLKISNEDIRIRKRKKRTGASILFAVDASGSMAAQKRMKETKNAILSLLMDSYQKRDEVAMISFNRNKVDLLLPFTRSLLLAKRELQDLKTGGKTPLSKALYFANNLIEQKMRKQPESIPILILISDGRANVGGIFTEDPINDAMVVASLIESQKIHSVVIDTEASFIKLGLPKQIARQLGASYYKIEDLKKETIEEIVHKNVKISLSNVEIMED